MLRQRLQTAAALVVFFVAVLLFSPPWLLCLVGVVIILAAYWEYLELTSPVPPRIDRLFCLFLSALVPVAASRGGPVYLYGSLFCSLFLLSLRSLTAKGDLKSRLEELEHHLFGILYVSFSMSHFLLLRNLPNWKPWIFMVLIVNYIGDGTAYFVGMRWGKRKLSPSLSPKKTLEGALGGLTASVLTGFMCKYLFFRSLTGPETLLVSLLVSVSGQLGDLVESLVKRAYGVKDSGRMLPGHGGILDRIDSILFAGPVGFYLAVFL